MPAREILDLFDRKFFTIEELELCFLDASSLITTIMLGFEDFSHLNSFKLANALGKIPPSVNKLHMRHMGLEARKGAEFKQIIEGIPYTVAMMDLSGNNFGNGSPADIAEGLASLSPNVTELRLDYNNLHNLSVQGIVRIFSSIPKTVKEISIAFNNLYKKNNNGELAEIFASFSPFIFSLIFSCNDHNSFDHDAGLSAYHLAQALRALKAPIRSLNLNSNSLHKNTMDETNEIFESIPETVQTLSIAGNFLGREKLAPALRHLRTRPKSLDLSFVFFLDDEDENNNDKALQQLKDFFLAIPASVIHINFTDNHFFIPHLAAALKITSARLKTIDFYNTNINSIDELILILDSLPPTAIVNGIKDAIKDQQLMKAKTLLDAYYQLSVLDNEEYSSDAHQNAFINASAIMTLIPKFISSEEIHAKLGKTKLDLLTDEILARIDRCLLQDDTNASLLYALNQIIKELILPLTSNNDEKCSLLLTLPLAVSDKRHLLFDGSHTHNADLTQFYSIELACYSYLIAHCNTSTELDFYSIFNSVFFSFCHYLSTGEHKQIIDKELDHEVIGKNRRLLVTSAKYSKAWQLINEQVLNFFSGKDHLTIAWIQRYLNPAKKRLPTLLAQYDLAVSQSKAEEIMCKETEDGHSAIDSKIKNRN